MQIPGAETGVEVAERVRAALGMPTNDPRTSHLRRNKYDMIEKLRSNKLHSIAQIKVKSAREALTWTRESKPSWPLVVKPINSAGGDGFYICETEEQVAQALENNKQKRNILGFENDEQLVQEFMRGTEYVVNGICWQGQCSVTDIWRYHKVRRANSLVYDLQELIDGSSPEVPEIVSYVQKATQSLGLLFGPFHAEVMLTIRGPQLVEVGARLQGGGVDTTCLEECLGHSQLRLTFQCYEEQKLPVQSNLALKKRAHWVDIILEEPGRIGDLRAFEAHLRQLDTYFSHSLHVKPNRVYPATVDLATSPGSVTLCGLSVKSLKQDHEKIRVLVNQFFEQA